MRSVAARFLVIRQVTQLNNGKKTAGIDGKLALDFKERFELEQKLKTQAFQFIFLVIYQLSRLLQTLYLNVLKVSQLVLNSQDKC